MKKNTCPLCNRKCKPIEEDLLGEDYVMCPIGHYIYNYADYQGHAHSYRYVIGKYIVFHYEGDLFHTGDYSQQLITIENSNDKNSAIEFRNIDFEELFGVKYVSQLTENRIALVRVFS
jgi:hypothetical protein